MYYENKKLKFELADVQGLYYNTYIIIHIIDYVHIT